MLVMRLFPSLYSSRGGSPIDGGDGAVVSTSQHIINDPIAKPIVQFQVWSLYHCRLPLDRFLFGLPFFPHFLSSHLLFLISSQEGYHV